jgi:hypothetical protein
MRTVKRPSRTRTVSMRSCPVRGADNADELLFGGAEDMARPCDLWQNEAAEFSLDQFGQLQSMGACR